MKPPWQLPEGWPKPTTPTSEDRAGGRKAYAAIKDKAAGLTYEVIDSTGASLEAFANREDALACQEEDCAVLAINGSGEAVDRGQSATAVGLATGHTVTETLRHLRYLESVNVVRTATDETGVMRWQPIPGNRWEIHAPF